MTTPQTIIAVAAFVVVDLLVVGAVVYAVMGVVRDLAGKFPPVPPRPDAVVKHYQSFRIGICNLGLCITAAVDEDYLHLTPNRFARIFGTKAMSLPWDAMQSKATRWGHSIAQVNGTEIVGPKWCFEVLK